MSLAPAAEGVRGTSRPPSPFVGLVPYDVGDAAFFFGRSTEVGIVVANLRAAPLTILYGPSGVGKSSLLMAGAFHDLCQEARAAGTESPFAVCVFKSWRDDPVQGLREAARVALQELAGEAQLSAPAATLVETLRAWTGSSGMLLAILDQFEEYFEYHSEGGSDDQLTGFAFELARIVNDPSLPVHVLLSIREDAWAKLDLFEGHISSLFGNYVRVDHLDLASAREAIEGPIAAWNRSLPEGELAFEIEPALVDEVLEATAGEGLTLTAAGDGSAPEMPADRVQAPFLQLVLERLWRDVVARGAHELTLARLKTLGGARRIVANHVLDALSRLTPAEQDIAADSFKVLVSSSMRKFARPGSDLADITRRPETEVSAVLDMLCSGENGRILRVVATSESGSKTYELSHDILAEPIVAWRTEHELQRKREAEEQRLREEREAEQERQQAARRRRRRVLAVLTLGLLVPVLAGLAIVAFVSRSDAKRAERTATSLALTRPANEQLARHVDVSLLLSLEAYLADQTTQATSSMISALAAVRRAGVSAILHGFQGSVTGVTFTSDGSTLAAAIAGRDGVVRVQLWDIGGQTQLDQPLDVGADVAGVALSPDGHMLAVAGNDGRVRLWDVGTRKQAGELRGQEATSLFAVAFSPDGETLAAIDGDGKLQRWEVGSQEKRGRLGGPAGTTIVAFSPGGRTLAVFGSDGKVRLWDVGRRAYVGQPLNVTGVAFSSDGSRLAATVAGPDGTVRVRLWDLGKRIRLGQPLDVGTDVAGVALSPDGRTLAVFGSDATVRLFEVGGQTNRGRLRVPSDVSLNGVAVSSNGLVAAASSDGTVRLWDVATHEPRGQLRGRDGTALNGVAVSSEGLLAAAGSDGTVRFWDIATKTPRDQLRGADATSVNRVAFSQDGHTLAVAGSDGAVRLWDVGTSPYEPLGQLREGGVSGVAFSPTDGDTLAVSGTGGVSFWDVSTSPHRKLGQSLAVRNTRGVAFSPDGRTLAVAGNDHKVRFWDVEDVDEPRRLSTTLDSPELFRGVAVSSDGTVATVSSRSVSLSEHVLWKDPDVLEERVCSLVWGTLDKSEWEKLTSGLGYRASCD